MFKNLHFKTVVLFILLIALVVGCSIISNTLWGGKSEQPLPKSQEWMINEGMTIEQFGKANHLSNPVLKEIFNLKNKSDLGKLLKDYGTPDEVALLIGPKLALASEHASKNWIKIFVKFFLWFIFLSAVFVFLKRRKMTPAVRKGLLLSAVVIFGIIMGSDPSPMGTVKDAIRLFATEHVIFPPRMIALTVFLLIAFLANKYICAWGCQLGTLQDLIFHLNQNDKHRAVIGRQVKVPFVITNTIRVAALMIFTAVAFTWGMDIIEPIDPFKIYNPLHLGIAGGIFAGLLMIGSLFVYRPWCHLFCPFGLAGWIIEKVSLFKIKVNYTTCVACERCASACPSAVMGAILKRDKKVLPDCFACNTCIQVCPTNSISFSTGSRALPPRGHFEKKKKA